MDPQGWLREGGGGALPLALYASTCPTADCRFCSVCQRPGPLAGLKR